MHRFVAPLVLFLTLSSIVAPLRAQMVRGQVVDSLTRLPVAGATVTLLDDNDVDAGRTVTDEEGLFLIRVTTAGSYRLRAERETYRTSTFPPFALDGTESKAFMLLIASLEPPAAVSAEDVMEELCGAGTVQSGQGVLTGFVHHAVTQAPVATARVLASWPAVYGVYAELVEGQEVGRLRGEVATDDAGVYVVCGIPAATPVAFHAASGEMLSDFVEVRFDSAGVLVDDTLRIIGQPLLRHDFHVVPPLYRSAAVSGMVLDAETMQPLSDVTVELADASVQTSTDATGAFRLDGLPAGPARLVLRHLGFRLVTREIDLAHEETVTFPPGALALETLPPELAPIVVSAERPAARRGLADFWERRERGGGDYLTREEWEQQGNAQIPTDVLRRMRGIRIVVGPGGGGVGTPGRRTVITSRGQTRTVGGRSGAGGCYPLYFVDGHNIGTSEYVDIDDIMNLTEVEAVEVYVSAATLPQEFNRPGSSCGVIAFWTR